MNLSRHAERPRNLVAFHAILTIPIHVQKIIVMFSLRENYYITSRLADFVTNVSFPCREVRIVHNVTYPNMPFRHVYFS